MPKEHYANSIQIIGPNVFKTTEYDSCYFRIFLYPVALKVWYQDHQ